MKFFALIILLISTTITGVCQQEGVYWLEDPLNSIRGSDICLTLSGGCYSIDVIDVISDDNIIEGTISFGKYHRVCNRLILKDDIFDYVFRLKTNKDGNLYVIQGFELLANKAFSGRIGCQSQIADERVAKKEQLIEQLSSYKKRKPIYKIANGMYDCGIMCNCALSFSEGQRYEYFFLGIKVSQGIWERQGDIIVLKDNKMKQPMYAFIEETGINGSFLPGCFPTCIMTFSELKEP